MSHQKSKGKEAYNQEMAAAVEAVLKECEIEYTFDRESGIFEFRMGCKGVLKQVRCYLVVKKICCSMVGIVFGVDKENERDMREMGELLHRINMRLNNMFFCLDYDKGAVLCKSFVMAKDEIAFGDMVQSSLAYMVHIVEACGGAIGAIALGLKGRDAYDLCEGKL